MPNNALLKDTNSVLFEGLRDPVGNKFVAKQAGTVQNDGSFDYAPEAMVLPDTSASGSLGVDQAAVTITLPGGQSTALIQITGTFSLTALFEGSADSGTTWNSVLGSQVGTSTVGTSVTTTGAFQCNVSGLTTFRVRCHPYTSGSASVIIRLSAGGGNTVITNATTLGQQTSANSTSVVVASDQTVAVKGNFTEVTGNGANVTGVNTDFIASMDVSAYKWLSIQISGTFSLTLQVQVSNDNVNFTSVQTVQLGGISINNFSTNNLTAAGRIVGVAVQSRYIRVRCTSYSSNASLAGVMELYTEAPSLAFGTTSMFYVPQTNGGTSDYHLISANTTNANNIKNAAGQVYGWSFGNNSASADAYVKLYNSASAPTAGSGTPLRTVYVPKGTSVQYHNTIGIAFSAGIGLTITGAMADNDTTAVGAAQVVVELDYF